MAGCAKCSRSDCDLLRCSRCGLVLYCSQDCQKGHWKTHKKIVSLFHEFRNKGCAKKAIFLMRSEKNNLSKIEKSAKKDYFSELCSRRTATNCGSTLKGCFFMKTLYFMNLEIISLLVLSQCKCFTVSSIPGKGFGMLATRSIKQVTLFVKNY